MNILSYFSTTHSLHSLFYNYHIKTYFLLNRFQLRVLTFLHLHRKLLIKLFELFLQTHDLEDTKVSMADYDRDSFSTPFQLTKTMHRSPYELILPEKPANSQKGEIIVITGAGQGLGQASANVWARDGASGIILAGLEWRCWRRPRKGFEIDIRRQKF
jgi:hypothetical protein